MQVFPSSKVYLLDKNDVLQNPVQWFPPVAIFYYPLTILVCQEMTHIITIDTSGSNTLLWMV